MTWKKKNNRMFVFLMRKGIKGLDSRYPIKFELSINFAQLGLCLASYQTKSIIVLDI